MNLELLLSQWLDWGTRPGLSTAVTALGIALAAALLGQLIYIVGRRLLPSSSLTYSVMIRARRPMAVVWPLLALLICWEAAEDDIAWIGVVRHLTILLLILAVTFAGTGFARGLGDHILRATEPESRRGEARARRVYTQAQMFTRLVIFAVVVVGLGSALMTFPGIRQFGANLLASAGVAGLILGFAARPVLSNLLAGVQIALTQPIRLEDVVIVEGEWGWVEEIKSTYVVIRIWDERRLVLPLQWFIDHPFQNWTRANSKLIGSVYWWVDYRMPLQPIRDEVQRVCESAPEWDGRLAIVQVTDSSDRALQIRGLVTAPDAPQTWDLRCRVREAVVHMIQRDYPEYLPRMRAEIGTPAEPPAAQAEDIFQRQAPSLPQTP
tara:strand:- start:5343 stop:6482 length:1140 start_codon:yes stop_codon:yes gene_type:complete